MKKIFIFGLLLLAIILFADYPDGNELIRKVDDNMYSRTTVSTSRMRVNGRRGSRTMEIQSWA